jgi:hypothetical protein
MKYDQMANKKTGRVIVLKKQKLEVKVKIVSVGTKK